MEKFFFNCVMLAVSICELVLSHLSSVLWLESHRPSQNYTVRVHHFPPLYFLKRDTGTQICSPIDGAHGASFITHSVL